MSEGSMYNPSYRVVQTRSSVLKHAVIPCYIVIIAVSLQEYLFVLREIEHYRKIKQQIRTKTKHETDAITADQREKILQQGREEGKQDFLRKIAATSATQLVSVT